MRARSAAAPTVEPCTGKAAITAGIEHSSDGPASTIDHRRHAPRAAGQLAGSPAAPHRRFCHGPNGTSRDPDRQTVPASP